MNKNELVEYLRAVCDGENALYACNEAIVTIQGELNMLHSNAAVKPSEPSAWVGDDYFYRGRKTTGEGFFGGGGVGAFIGGLIGLIVAISVESFAFAFISIPFGVIIGAVLGAIVGTATDAGSVYSEKTSQRDAAYDIYQQNMQKYHEELYEYEHKSEVEQKIEKKLLDMIEENNIVKERIRNELEKLYARDIVYGRFRNIVAVSQILEYLEMGLCEELTGPNGAYAEYMLDVRTDRICDSIDSLKKAMQNMMSQVLISQNQIIGEIRKTNDNMVDLKSSLRNEISDIKDQVGIAIKTAEQTNARIDSTNHHLQVANSKIGQMNNILSASAHNQYIALRERNE